MFRVSGEFAKLFQFCVNGDQDMLITSKDPTIRDVCLADLDEIAVVHCLAFPDFLMTLLGHAFLVEYYRTVLDYPQSVFLAAVDRDEKIVGFIAGFQDPAMFYKLLGVRKKRMMATAVFHLATRPRLWIRVLENIRQIGQRSDCSLQSTERAELASVGVVPDFLQRGCGRTLVREFLSRSVSLKAAAVELTTDAQGNDKVNRFYQNIGFRLVRASERAGGRRMNHYEYVL